MPISIPPLNLLFVTLPSRGPLHNIMKASIKGNTWLYATVLSFSLHPCTLAKVLSSPAELATREYDFIVLGGMSLHLQIPNPFNIRTFV